MLGVIHYPRLQAVNSVKKAGMAARLGFEWRMPDTKYFSWRKVQLTSMLRIKKRKSSRRGLWAH